MRRGFSLVEALISLVILAVVFLGLAASIMMSHSMAMRTSEQESVLWLASDALDALERGDSPPSSVPPYSLSYSSGDVPQGRRWVVTVTWDSASGPRSLSFERVMPRDPSLAVN
ncbi:type IV pilus modification PilV family protein [Thermanaerovibrio acidaminovorans]|jgi:general secretion pathway protein I|uniref:type IV pilus modification PilV family protein n=1 Tax=Thermanaerovibrio acidaminovorans TaxID=81462 RepID=UPI002493A49D|nr:prepilin-type N-terminal cleavage/methylation domain-containing protein [Thermanaerovibrio acidaminovorans]